MIQLLFPLKIDGFGPVLNALGDRGEPDGDTLFWIGCTGAFLLIASFVAYRVLRWLRRRDRIARGFDQLQKVIDHKGLNTLEGSALERLSLAVPDANPAQIAGSIDGFDAAVVGRMKEVQKLPWLELELEIDKLTAIREKLGFRYIPEDRRPRNTRHVMVDQYIYILAKGEQSFRLLSAPVTALNDLAIYTDAFKEGDQVVRLKAENALWAFFWSVAGGECRFSTRLLRAYDMPAVFLMFEHGDELIYNDDRKIFSCDLDLSVNTERVAVESYGRRTPSQSTFEKFKYDRIPTQLVELSASGFVLSPAEAFKEGDLVRVRVSDPDLAFLDNCPAKVVNFDGSVVRCRFLSKTREQLEQILHFVTPRISKNALKGRSRRKTIAQT